MNKPTRERKLELEHKVFKSFEECHFQKSDLSDEALFVLQMAEGSVVSLPLGAICKEFGIDPDSKDGELIELVDKALNYVNVLRPGDDLPLEVLTGEASWHVDEDHRAIAYNRLTMQLVTWMSGNEELITDPDQLMQIAEDPGTKKKINQAFDEVAEKLNIGHDNREEVVNLVHQVAEELSYVETLRDKYRDVKKIDKKLQELRRIYAHEKGVLETVTQSIRLIDDAMKKFETSFDEIDANTGEIMSVLRNFTSQRQYIRNKRDDLYRRLRAWEPLFERWNTMELERGTPAVKLVRDTYQFLAPRFMKVKQWLLMTKVQDGIVAGQNFKNEEDRMGALKGKMMQW
ncbi:hypothetical protein [Thalassospira alkalitolerans]|uniref:Uncharacterized protein n=1 Tax=Thalassospira alkalitolerans TaxID=1293890 RepID=A0A1Y2LAD5_9PROT|nr:hypothetical protein [Thalassospira alkalitolerans]OSQ47340.1 hypothetical protein TALK_12270 [Thalassospira alkalitolerans]|tara:strand:- start:382301 stop:383335 length:1035 start_codon:yes stop_codon:yes gene_type:complete